MSLTKEQNDKINELRHQLTDALTALNHLAREVGADPIPTAGPPVFVGAMPISPPQFISDK